MATVHGPFAISLLFLVSSVISQDEDGSCQELTDCLREIGAEGQANLKLERMGRMLKRLKEARNIRCSDRDLDELKDKLAEMGELQQERKEKVTRCIGGDRSAFPGCPAFPLPNPMVRECISDRREMLEFLGFRRRRLPRKVGRRNRFKQCVIGQTCACPEAKLCHECYELSSLHDDIHRLKLQMQKQRLECGIPERPKPGERNRGPQQEETLAFSFTN